MSILLELRRRFRSALAGLAEDADPLLEMIRPSQDARFGDYQAEFAMTLGKTLKRPPRELAAEVVARLDVADLCQPPEVAGPGFINLRVRDDWLAARLAASIGDQRLGVATAERPRTYVIDYSAPNVAKPMHVGHIRSTVIGESLCRTLAFLGHRVISDNHIGDWGTQFGMILYGWRHFRDEAAYRQSPVHELARLYRLVRQLMDYHDARGQVDALAARRAQQQAALDTARQAAGPKPDKQAAKHLKRLEADLAKTAEEFQGVQATVGAVQGDPALAALAAEHADINAAVLAETARLHAGDAENLRLWREFLPPCLEEIEKIYRRLGVRFDHTLGESFYHDRLAPLVDELVRRGIARESEGAVAIFFDGQDVPMLVRKQDGAFLYATTDLATIRYRMETWQPDAILYVVDHRQSLHFQQLFAAARQLGYEGVEFQHISFGTVLGDDGRPFKTRSGDTVGLEGLLDEAVSRAAAIVAANDDAKPGGPELSPDERARVAETVGIAALKYADLSQNRTSDYVFSYDKMLAMNGNTATYMQYAYARVSSIFAKGGVDVADLRAVSGTLRVPTEVSGTLRVPSEVSGTLRVPNAPQAATTPPTPSAPAASPIRLDTPAERALGLALLRFGEAIERAAAEYRPNLLTGYLFELANCYSTFFENCPVLKAPTPELRQSRLLLCDLTARTIRQGLDLLGIQVVARM